MILIAGKAVQPEEINGAYVQNSVQKEIAQILFSSNVEYNYDSLEQLQFEIQLRSEIIASARALNQSDMAFAIFRKTRCNPTYWERTEEGGFVLKRGQNPSSAIRNIFENGSQYATECATAMMIVYYKALLSVYTESHFNQLFPSIELMNWHHIDPLLKEVGTMKPRKDYLPGDRRYFSNPDVDPLEPQWQGENVIDLGRGLYYGHGIGLYSAETIIQSLNQNRAEDADQSAYLDDSAGRPNFKKLAGI